MRLNKVVATVMGVVLLGTGMVFAGKAIIDSRNTVKVAEENGYFENVDMEYITHNGLGIKIENYFVDKSRVGVTFNIKSDEKFAWGEFHNDSNPLWEIMKFFNENGEEIKNEGAGYGPKFGEYERIDNNTVRVLYTVPIYSIDFNPSKFKISINRIELYKTYDPNIPPSEREEGIEYTGNWDFEIDIADRFLEESNIIKYNATVNVNGVSVKRAELNATKLIVILKADNLVKLWYGLESSDEPGERNARYGTGNVHAENGEIIDGEQAWSWENNEITVKYDISKFNAEDSYKIVFDSKEDGGEPMVVTLNK